MSAGKPVAMLKVYPPVEGESGYCLVLILDGMCSEMSISGELIAEAQAQATHGLTPSECGEVVAFIARELVAPMVALESARLLKGQTREQAVAEDAERVRRGLDS